MLLGAIGYSLARYKNYAKKWWAWALSNLDTNFKPSCLTQGGHGGEADTQITLY